jgi:hypothetical protein
MNKNSVEGLDIDTLYGTDCHGSGNYVHFTIAYANGTLARDPQGQPGLFHFGTGYEITYVKLLKKTLFNDPMSGNISQEYSGCNNDHCFSGLLPGVAYNNEPIRLMRVNDPNVFRTGWTGSKCRYDDQVRNLWKNAVYLGGIGYYIDGANIPRAIIDFVEERVRPTYPTVEIFMIVFFTCGVIPSLIAALHTKWSIAVCGRLPWYCTLVRWGYISMRSGITSASNKGRRTAKNGWREMKDSWGKAKDGWEHWPKHRTTHVEAPQNQQPTARQLPTVEEQLQSYEQSATYELPDWPSVPSAPPSYKATDTPHGCREDLRVFCW